MNVKISDSAIYFIWAYQGVLMDDTNLDFENLQMILHLSVPSESEIKDRNNSELSGEYLKKKVEKVCQSLAMSFEISQGIKVRFDVDIRDEYWKREYAKNSVKEMMDRIINGDPFTAV